jgi:hypothetical protein
VPRVLLIPGQRNQVCLGRQLSVGGQLEPGSVDASVEVTYSRNGWTD